MPVDPKDLAPKGLPQQTGDGTIAVPPAPTNTDTSGKAGGQVTPEPYGPSAQNNNVGPGYTQYHGGYVGSSGGFTSGPGLSDLGAGTNATFMYADPRAFQDPNAANIYGVINEGINNRANQAAPMAAMTALGAAQQYGGAQAAPQMMLGGAQISPQMMTSGAGLNTAQDLQYAGAQNQTINDLYNASKGLGPSVATIQAQQLAQQNTAAQMAALGSQRGAGNAALGQRAAMMQGAQANQAAAQQGALGRAQEAIAAQNQLQATLAGARGQTQSTATTQAQLQQQALLANQGGFNQAALQQAQLNQQAGMGNQALSGQMSGMNAQMGQQAGLANAGALNQFGLQQGQMNQQTNLANLTSQGQQRQLNAQQYAQMLQAYMQQNQTDISNQAALQQLLGSEQQGVASLDYGQGINNTNNQMGLIGAGVTALGGAMAASDERVKKNIRDGGYVLRAFLDAMRAK